MTSGFLHMHGRRGTSGECVERVTRCKMLCGAIYADLYTAEPDPSKRNWTYLSHTNETIMTQVHNSARNFWSWIDAIHMGMHSYANLAMALPDVASQDKILDAMLESK